MRLSQWDYPMRFWVSLEWVIKGPSQGAGCWQPLVTGERWMSHQNSLSGSLSARVKGPQWVAAHCWCWETPNIKPDAVATQPVWVSAQSSQRLARQSLQQTLARLSPPQTTPQVCSVFCQPEALRPASGNGTIATQLRHFTIQLHTHTHMHARMHAHTHTQTHTDTHRRIHLTTPLYFMYCTYEMWQ